MKTKILFIAFIAVLTIMGCKTKHKENPSRYVPAEKELKMFENHITALANELKIAGFSFAVLNENQVIYSNGVGFTDTENKIPVNEKTEFPIGEMAEIFAGTLIMQLQENEKIDIKNTISDYENSNDRLKQITIKQILSHTSNDKPGTTYSYNPLLFMELDTILKITSGKDFDQLFKKNIIRKLGMKETAKNKDIKNSGKLNNYLSSVSDLSEFSMAIDNNRLFKDLNSADLMFRPVYLKNGERSPMGIGWFIQFYKDKKFAWSFGQGKNYSSLIIKSLSDSLSLIVLSNSENLNAPFKLQKGDIIASPFAVEFLKTFIFHLDTIPKVAIQESKAKIISNLEKAKKSKHRDLVANEFLSFIRIKQYMGQTEQCKNLSSIYSDVFPFDLPVNFLEQEPRAMIKDAGDYINLNTPFVIEKDTIVTVYAVGEFCKELDASPWDADNVELFFDINNSKKSSFDILDGNSQYRINYDYIELTGNFSSSENIEFKQIDISDNKYLFEIRLPWKTLGKVTAKEELKIGFDVMVSDNDGDGRHVGLAWNSKKNHTPWSNVDVLGTMILAGKELTNAKESICYSVKTINPIKIDGIIERDWNESPKYAIKNECVGKLTDAKDNSSVFRSKWDDNYLYFMVEVTDNVKRKLKFTKDFGWIENAQNDTIWAMDMQNTQWAGGFIYNRYVNTSIPLKAGKYTLHYATNQSNSSTFWRKERPETTFYGIAVY